MAAKLKTYIATGVFWPDAARAVGAPRHVSQVDVYFADTSKKAAEDFIARMAGGYMAKNIVKASRLNDSAVMIRALREAGHLSEQSLYAVAGDDLAGERIARLTPVGFERVEGPVRRLWGGKL